MHSVTRGRRAMLAALCASVLACALPAAAQDPSLTGARLAALDWLELADKDDAVATYANAARRFRDTMTFEKWAAAMKQAREQFGPVIARASVGAQRQPPAKDVPPGNS